MSESTTARQTALYRFYGDNDELLYVGIAFNPTVRFVQHRKTKWWHLAVRHTIAWFPSRPEAEAAETMAIQMELPRYNVTDHPYNKPAAPRRYAPADPAHGMTAAKFRTLREFLGLTGDWLADYLGVLPRTLRNWEQGKYRIPEGPRLELEDLATLTTEFVRKQTERIPRGARKTVIVYRTDADFHAEHPGIRYPAFWHRACAARIAREVQTLRIAFAETVSDDG